MCEMRVKSEKNINFASRICRASIDIQSPLAAVQAAVEE